MRERKIVTLDDIIDAIEQNGYVQGYKDFFTYNYELKDEKRVGSACALGQAALNLDVDEFHLMNQLNTVFDGLGYDIANKNDMLKWDLPHIAKWLRRKLLKETRSFEFPLAIDDHIANDRKASIARTK
jgi:hypothetical protein